MTFHEMNPTLKFLTVTCLMFGLAFMYNPWTPLLVFTGTLLLQTLFADVSWRRWGLFMIPFLLTAIGTLWTTLVFGREAGGAVVFTLFGNDVTEENVRLAVTLALRVLAVHGTLTVVYADDGPEAFRLQLDATRQAITEDRL